MAIAESEVPLQLTRSQFAMVRAYLQGLPVDWIAGRYLVDAAINAESIPDQRIVQRTLTSYLHALVRLAYQHDQLPIASLLSGPLPRSSVAVQKAIDAVNTLERLGATRPRLHHGVELWFSPPLARRLRRARLESLADIVGWVNKHGAAWWRHVPRIGEKAAGTVASWLLMNREHLGANALADYVAPPRSVALPASMVPQVMAPGVDRLVPLELIQLSSPALDGSRGRNRASNERCRLSAKNDYEAIRTWLSLYSESGNTWRAYRKEAERFLLWAVVERGCAMSDLTVEDCVAYRDFLANPAPTGRWTGPMTERWSSAWRPFQGGLSLASQKHAQTILKSMCEWLMRQRYLDSNPWDGVPARARVTTPIQISRALAPNVWEQLQEWLAVQSCLPGEAGAQARVAHAAFLLLRDTGLRREEACRARRLTLRFVEAEEDSGWELDVVGKGGRERTVFPSPLAVAALRAHWADRGIGPSDTEDVALLSPIRYLSNSRSHAKFLVAGRDGYSPEGLHRLIRTTIERFISQVDADETRLELKHIRAHSLRHSFGVHAVAAGIELDVIQGVLGHSSLSTTTIYVQGDRVRRRRQSRLLYKSKSVPEEEV